MFYENAVIPTREQLKEFGEANHGKEIFMVNLLKFKEKAEYADGRDTDLTGAQAYAIYAEGVTKILNSFGGDIVFGGRIERLMLGTVEELWDQVAIAKYPSREAMGQMIASPEYAEISPHRDAGLAGQLNIETTQP
ncbi:MAG: DUF1330 domain-containing protein [Parvibaculales bacterium]